MGKNPRILSAQRGLSRRVHEPEEHGFTGCWKTHLYPALRAQSQHRLYRLPKSTTNLSGVSFCLAPHVVIPARPHVVIPARPHVEILTRRVRISVVAFPRERE